MTSLVLYHQQRADNGVRTGVDVNGELVLHRFQEGSQESDPALRWFIDVRCEGKKLPSSADKARQWLVDQAAIVHDGLKSLADELKVGMEPDLFPLTRSVKNAPRGVTIRLVCSAVRRVDAREMAKIVGDLDKNWEELLQSLSLNEPVAR